MLTKSGVYHADCRNTESVGTMRGLGKGEALATSGGRIVYLIQEKGSRVLFEKTPVGLPASSLRI